MTKRVDAFYLKIIGIVLMVLDHIHQMWAADGAPMWLTMLGRVVAPIFLFLAAEGVHYTRNRLAYLRNLLTGFWLMSIIDLYLPKLVPNDSIVLMNNIFSTLFLSAVAMIAYDSIRNGIRNKEGKKIGLGILIIIVMAVFSVAPLLLMSHELTRQIGIYSIFIFPSLLFTEGGFLLVLLGLLFFIFREKRLLQVVSLLIVAFISTRFQFTDLFTTNIQWMMAFAAIPMLLYSGKEGKKMKWFFYFFYPAHIVVLYLLATLVF